MLANGWHLNKFLVDGFPRSYDNVDGWNQEMGDKTTLGGVLWFDANEETLTKRILQRSLHSGRNDDNPETLLKRFA